MREAVIALSDKGWEQIDKLTQRHNDMNGTKLTSDEWLTLQVRQLAIGETLAVAQALIQQQEEAERAARVQRAVRAKQEELLASV